MWGGTRRLILIATGFTISFTACGGGSGGGSGGGVQPPPPIEDFSINISPSSVTVAQNSTSSISVNVASENGFTGTVSITFSGLPAGVTTNPTSPFSVISGQSTSIVFGAAANASPGSSSISAQGTSGSLTHTSVLTMTVQSGVVQSLSKTTYLRTDSVAALDSPPGEPHRRHILFDPTGQRFFVANQAMNRVDVLSSTGDALLTSIDAPGATNIDLSADGGTLWIATSLEQILSVDTHSLQVQQRYPIAGLTPIPSVVFNRPTELVSTSGGELFVRLQQPSVAQSFLASWDPSTNTITNLTSAAPAVFQNGMGVMARSADYTHFFAGANDGSGEAVLFDANGNVLAGPKVLTKGNIVFAALSGNGSKVSVLAGATGNREVLLFDSQLNLLGNYAASNASSLLFSHDGQTLYVAEALGNGRVITALSASSLQIIGQVPDIAIGGVPSVVEDINASQLLCGLSNRGVSFIDASQFVVLGAPAPMFAPAPVAQPAEGANTGGTVIKLGGTNFAGPASIRFGPQSAVGVSVTSSTQMQITTPASATTGAMNLTGYFSNNWIVLAPSSFSFAPSVAKILPNASGNDGGHTVEIYGYGFGSDPSKITVTIGGQTAAVQSVATMPAVANSLALDSTYPFSLEQITVATPPGASGKADVVVQTPTGSISVAKGFQFLASSKTFANPSLYKFILYDSARQMLYLSATDHVDMFNLATQVFQSPLEPPPNGPPPDAALRGLALTPDGSQLVVADFGAQSVYLVNPDGVANNGTKVAVGGVAGYLNSGPARVAATSAQSVFVGMSGEGSSNSGCNGCLGQMNLLASPPTFQPAPQPEVSSIIGAPLLQSDFTGDTVYLAFHNSPGGPVAAWSATSPDTFQFSSANDSSTDLTAAADGTYFALLSNSMTEIRDAGLVLVSTPTSPELESIPQRVAVPGIALHPSGALVYQPFLDGPAPAAPPATGIHGGIDIRDAHNGKLRLRVQLPEPFAMLSTDIDGLHGNFLTTDEYGQRLFAVTSSGLTIVQLASVPLGIGTLAPATGSAVGGTAVTLRGSGFQSGTKVTLGGKATTVTFKDMNTLSLITPVVTAGPQQIVLTNPDGETVSLDAAFYAQ
jgi:hypothetical protein